MAQKHSTAPDPAAEPKKRRRVGFSGIDAGVDPNGCFKVYLVSREEEVGAPDSFCLDPVDLSHFFEEEDGKIYGYEGLKISVWVSCVSFHSYAEIAFESKSDGGKGITDLNTALKNMFGETLVDNKDDFLQTFSKETQFIRSTVSAGEILKHKHSDGHVNDSVSNLKVGSDVEAVRMLMGDMTAGHLYSRLVPLVLLLVDGSNPIDVTDSSWELYLLIQKTSDQQGNFHDRLLGFAAVYRFYHYPDSSRLRLGQILVLPLYQRKGYGRYLLEVLNNVAIADDVYDFTIEEPVDNLQHLRTCIDVQRLLSFDKVQQAVNSTVSQLKQGKLSKKTYIPRLLPPPSVVEDARKRFKINKKQFLQCWEILVYLGLDPADKSIQDYFSVISNRVRADILGKDSETAGKKVIEVPSDFDPEMSFVMHRAKAGGEANGIQVEDNQNKQEEQLQQLIDERLKDIKLIAQKVSRK
ncbi:histone acetyltransferase type B catalytic subunit [Eucalyptus grandis]|uniref:histone acetyltransferase type B catalytic subunit n=1 Tax=Eucalyptus grandis TaxID=71139 RepID=UPI00192EA10D|nr:histone acetyltransferase type B catalytic subunit [Eucalyptus grandis]